MLLALFVINKSGTLIYYKAFEGSRPLSTNDMIRVGSTFDTFSALIKQISPVGEHTVIESLTTDTFVLNNFKTDTGFTFFVTAKLGSRGLYQFLKEVYSVFTDYVLKNPFYSMDQTVNKQISKLFTVHIEQLVQTYNRRGGY